TPADPNQTDRITRWAMSNPGNHAVFMGRAKMAMIPDENGKPFFGDDYVYRYGRMETIRSGDALALVTAGNMMAEASDAWCQLNDRGHRIALISVSDWSDLHPDDIAMLSSFERIITLEDHNVKTGLGNAITVALADTGYRGCVLRKGVTEYGASGKPADLYKRLCLDAESVVKSVISILDKQSVKS
ncbi:MAG: transketolase C-terminal domain-containing protein, partial [candidate division Zixibacteria bacterium]